MPTSGHDSPPTRPCAICGAQSMSCRPRYFVLKPDCRNPHGQLTMIMAAVRICILLLNLSVYSTRLVSFSNSFSAFKSCIKVCDITVNHLNFARRVMWSHTQSLLNHILCLTLLVELITVSCVNSIKFTSASRLLLLNLEYTELIRF